MKKFLYRELTWLEVKEAAAEDRLVLQPVGTLEDHGLHLPIDTDAFIVEEICKRAAEKIKEEVILMPTIVHGYSPHHMDFPGPITIKWSTFIEYLLDVLRSLAHHGFKRFLIVNGHGSNEPLVDLVSRLIIIEKPDIICATTFYGTGSESQKVITKIRETEFPGEAHAGEIETSMYLALKPELVRLDKAVKDMDFQRSENIWIDLGWSPVKMMEYWSKYSSTGTMGDPTRATPEKGKALIEAAVKDLINQIKELRKWEIKKRVDHH